MWSSLDSAEKEIWIFKNFPAKNLCIIELRRLGIKSWTYAVDAGQLLGHHHHHGDDQGLPQGRVDDHLLQGHLRYQLHALLKILKFEF